MNEKQKKTIESFKKVDEHLYSLVYQSDYNLDHALDSDISNTLQLLTFMTKEMKKIGKKKDVEGFACSCFEATTGDGSHVMGRNFDYMAAPLIAVWTAPKNGYKSVSVANCTFMLYGNKSVWPMKNGAKKRLLFAPYCCMDGMNEKGLAIAILEIKTKATQQKEKEKKEFTTTLAVRAVLDKCATVDEAIAEFSKYNMHDAIWTNYHYQILDASGDSCVIEFVDNKMSVVRKKPGETLAVTNYFLTEGGDNRRGFGYERHDFLVKTADEKGTAITKDDAMKLLEYVSLNYQHERGYMIISLWSSVYDVTTKTMDICQALNFKNRYRVSIDKPGEFVNIGEAVTDIKDFGYRHKDDIPKK